MNETLSDNTTTGTQPSHEDITRRAQELWEKYGRPSGRDEEIWYEAERDLKSATPVAPAAASEPTPTLATPQVTSLPKPGATATPKTSQSSRASAAAKIPTLRASKNGR